MDAELNRLYAQYRVFVRQRTLELGPTPRHKYSRHLWGAPLSQAQFRARWKRICIAPKLEEYWRSRLAAAAGTSLDEDIAA